MSNILDKKRRLIKASEILRQYLAKPQEVLYRIAMQEDCLDEMSTLIPLVIEMLDDEMYYDELAWELQEN
jgi:hypothetical protein